MSDKITLIAMMVCTILMVIVVFTNILWAIGTAPIIVMMVREEIMLAKDIFKNDDAD